MNRIVLRTCTEVRDGSADRLEDRTSHPLEVFRDRPAYVLLGDPGSGKTTAFEQECETLGQDAHFVTARDFQKFEPDDHPEWWGKTLFIDGLDEIRAGASDARQPFDDIRRRFDQLGKPPFRLSCRAADWLGANDEAKLTSVTQNGKVPTVLLLDPLTDSDIREILNCDPNVDDPEDFIEVARERGEGDLLTNPQTLVLIAKAVAKDGNWPQSRTETFEMACLHMATENNDEHRIAGGLPGPERVLKAAGRLSAALLLSGSGGYTLENSEPEDSHPGLESFGEDSRELLRAALSTKLFKSVGMGRFEPVHRHIAEFLGGRYLAQVTGDGLPARRATALMTGYDGSVVTELRGLSAWFAAHCRDARNDLIARDPTGVGLYGDIRNFGIPEKRDLLLALGRGDSRLGGADTARAFAPLAAPDLEEPIQRLLTDPSRSTEYWELTGFILRVLCYGIPLPGLAGILLELVRDATAGSRARVIALKAFVWNCADSSMRNSCLRALLSDIQAGVVSDEKHELLGTLLFELYPDEIPPGRIWDYLRDDVASNFFGSYFLFWKRRLLAKSNGAQVATLLDSAAERCSSLRTVLRRQSAEVLLLELLARGLEENGDESDANRLYSWLNISADEFTGRYRARQEEVPVRKIRDWLEQRPDSQKAVILEGLNSCAASETFRFGAHRIFCCLYGASPPSDLGRWCLEQAAASAETNPRLAEFLLEQAFFAHKKQAGGHEGLSVELLQEQCRNSDVLKSRLQNLLSPPEPQPQVEQNRYEKRYTDERHQDEQRWLAYVSSNQQELVENRAPPHLLYELAKSYFGDFLELSSGYGSCLIEKLFDDNMLVDAAMQGIRGTVERADVPETEEIITLIGKSQMHYLGLPFLAGLNELEGTDQGSPAHWDLVRIRKALVFYYSILTEDYQPWWYQRLLDERPDIVADLQVEFAVLEFKRGAEFVSKVDRLAHDPLHAQVARCASPRLLRAFPTRCKAGQLGLLNDILWAAIRYADRASLLTLVQEKCSRKGMNVSQRARWLAAALVLSPEEHIEEVEDFVAKGEKRVVQLIEFFPDRITFDLSVPAMEMLVRTIGTGIGPTRSEGLVTPAMHASEIVYDLISRMAGSSSQEATDTLERLTEDSALFRWKEELSLHRDRQRVVRRDAQFRHPTIQEVCRTLDDGAPASAADLWALLVDRLDEMSIQVKKSNTDDWRQYWNEPVGYSPTPKHEDHCRDALLSDLRQQLPSGVDAEPEGQYANDKRADIRVSCQDFQVPVEIKKNSHRKLWTAASDQLIAQYASSPEADGYGIYLVFWFGAEHTKTPPPSGNRPKTVEQLRQQLEGTLIPDKARKISVCVIDVSRES